MLKYLGLFLIQFFQTCEAACLQVQQRSIYLFYLGRLTDDYYKDKSVAAMRYNDRYAQSKDANKEYKRYAVDRKVYLREQIHQNTSK